MVLLGKAVRAYREKHGISLRKFARLLEVDHTVLYNFEQGRVIESDTLSKILLLLFCNHNPDIQQSTTTLCQPNSRKSKSAVPVSSPS